MALALALAGCGDDACASEHPEVTIAGAGPFAFRAAVDADVVNGEYRGTASNRSATEDCALALYAFPAEPRREALPTLRAGDIAPEVLPGGGVLIVQRFLPAARARTYVVPVEDPEHSRRFDERLRGSSGTWLVGVTCTEAELDIHLMFSLVGCNDERPPPGPSAEWLVRAW